MVRLLQVGKIDSEIGLAAQQSQEDCILGLDLQRLNLRSIQILRAGHLALIFLISNEAGVFPDRQVTGRLGRELLDDPILVGAPVVGAVKLDIVVEVCGRSRAGRHGAGELHAEGWKVQMA